MMKNDGNTLVILPFACQTCQLSTYRKGNSVSSPGHQLPIGSMYGIYANIGDILMVNVIIYSIHGSYGL